MAKKVVHATLTLMMMLGWSQLALAAPPVFVGPITVLNTLEDVDASRDLTGVVTDPDLDPITYLVVAVSHPAIALADISGTSQLDITVAPDLSGTGFVRISATDGVGPPVVFDQPVNVQAQNDDPTFMGPIPSIDTFEDVDDSVDLTGVVKDVDGDVITYTIVPPVSHPAIDSANMSGGSVLEVDLLPNLFANGVVRVRADDGNGGTPIEFDVPVNVAEQNDDPYPTGLAISFSTTEDVNDSIDVDGIVDDFDIATNMDSLTYAVESIDNAAVQSATMAGSVLNVTVAADQNQVGGSITVRVTDAFGGTPVDVVIPVDVLPDNDDPIFVGPVPTLNVDEDAGGAIDLEGVVDDVDILTNADSLNYAVVTVTNPATPLISAAGMAGSLLNVSVESDQFGSATVTVRVTDSGGGAPIEFDVPVNVNEVNDDPFPTGFVPTFLTVEDVDDSLDLDGIVDDADIDTNGDSLNYSVVFVDNDAIASASMSGSILSVDVADNQHDTGLIIVQVTDSFGGAPVLVPIPAEVTAVNDDPVLSGAIPTLNTDEDVPGSVDLVDVVTDVDVLTSGDTLSYNIVSVDNDAVDSANMVGSILQISVLPDAFEVGGSILVQVTDNEATAPVDVLVPVNVGAVNDVPTTPGSVANVDVLEDAVPEVVDFAAVFDDADIPTGDSLTISASQNGGDPIFAGISVTGSEVTLSFAPDANGSADVLVEAVDSQGASAPPYLLNVMVQPVNDPPEIAGSLGNRSVQEDEPVEDIFIADAFDDIDGDPLNFDFRDVTVPELFSDISISGDDLTVVLFPNANGVTDVTVFAIDPDGAQSPGITFTITVNGVDDPVVAVDDAVAGMTEDDGELRIDVLANDDLGDPPTSIVNIVSIGTHDIIDVNGDTIATPDGTVVIDGDELVFTPTANFWGEADFRYVIRDVDGEEDDAEVTFYVDPVNDPPEGRQSHRYEVLEGSDLEVEAFEGLLLGAFDIDPAQVDENGDPIAPQPLSAVFESSPPPSEGVLVTTASDGSFIFRPVPGFIGETSFTYAVSDNSLKSEIGTVTIEVLALPPVGAAPNPGEVAVFFNLANTPLEQSASVEPNVLVTMDDSGSMDWHITVDGADDNGRFVINNNSIATSDRRSTIYPYLFDLDINAYCDTCSNGRILPSQESLPAGNDYAVWQARSAAYNGIYYNPEVRYEPWTGTDNASVDFADADPESIRLDPMSSGTTFDITTLKSYHADNVPNWDDDGGRTDITVTDYYIPRYYTAGGTLVEIEDDGSTYTGGPERTDCADSDACTYDEEIQNFANWFQYFRSRELVAKAALGGVVAELQDIRVGYETINRRSNEPVAEMNEYYWEGEKQELLEEIYKTNSSGSTPLRRALNDAGRILGCTHDNRDCPSLPVPEGICQQNFTLLFSDGYWNGSAPRSGNFDTDGDGIWDGGKYADTHSDTLADIAMYYYENDLFPSYEDGVPLSSADIRGVPDGTFDSSFDLIHQHMKTFTIAFGVEPDIDAASAEAADATDTIAWPSPTSAPNAKIDDMLHAAINGRGRFLNAGSPEALKSAVGAAFREFTQAVSSSSAAAFNSTSLREGTLLYRGFYDLRNRTGELTASVVSTDGIIAADPTWGAARLLDADADGGLTPEERVIFTYDPSSNSGMPFRYNELTANQQLTLDENEVNFIRGERTFEEPGGTLRERLDEEGLLGDIVNSSPVFVGEPRGINRDQSPFPVDDLYSQWVNDVKDRRKIVYVGANDGMLHGFDAETGVEVMGYVPNMIMDASLPYSNKLNNFPSAFYLHDYYVDLSPRLNDVYMRPSTSSSKQWLTTLVGGLGAGGKSFFALNVTDPDTQFADEATAKDAVLWEFTDADDTYPVDTSGNPLGGSVGAITDFDGNPVKDMGYSLSLPVVTMSNILDTDNENEWVAIFGNGTNSTSGIATLFVLFMDRGLDGWQSGDFVKLSTGYGVPLPGEPLEGFPNALGSPTAVDKNLDGTVDLVYAGDRLGNLFRFEVEGANTNSWKVVRLFTANYEDGNGDVTIQPILSRPLVVKHPEKNGFLVTFGTGSFITDEDGSDTDIQSIYTIWDPLVSSPPTANDNTKEVRLVEQEITNVVDDSLDPAQTRRIVTSNAVSYTAEDTEPGVYGWYIDLDMVRAEETISGETNTDISGNAPPDVQFPGEKAIRRFIFRDGAILTTTVLPSSNATSCFGSRPGALLILDGLTGGDPGEAIVDFNVDGYVDENDLLEVDGENFTAGLLFDHSQLDGQLVDLSTLGGEGDTDFLFICGGNECISRRIRDINDAKTGRLSWTTLQAD